MSGMWSAAACLRICLAANALLAVGKFIAGTLGNSRALVADAINSLLDVVSSTVAWLGYRISQRPPDEGHPYGHGNADVLAAVFVGLVIFGTGVFIAEGAWSALRGETRQPPSFLAVGAAAVVIIIKGILLRYTSRVAEATRSPAVHATAVDHRADILATSGALVGVLVARAVWPFFDPLAAIWVAAMIIYHAVRILQGNVYILMSGQPASTRLKPVMDTILEAPGVLGVHRWRARVLGSRIILEVEILVDREISVGIGHDIAEQAKRAALESHQEVLDLVVHVEPLEEFRRRKATPER